MKIMDWEIRLISRGRVIAMRHIEDILEDILLHHKPRATREPHALALPNGMEPEPPMLTNASPRFQFNNITWLFTKIPSDIVIIVDLPQETDTLRILAPGIYQVLPLSHLTHLILHIMANREEGLTQLPVVDLSQEICLVLHRVRTRTEPLPSLCIHLSLGIMASGNQIIVMPTFLVESPELDESVAHHIWVRGITSPHLLHGIGRHLIPILLMTVDHLKSATILMSHSRRHLEILLRRTVPLLFLLRTNLDIKTIRMQSQSCKLVDHHTTVDSSREEHRHALIIDFVQIHFSLLTFHFSLFTSHF